MTHSSGTGSVVYGRVCDGDVFGLDAAHYQVAYVTDTHLVTFTVNGGGPIDIAHNQVRAGDLVSLGPAKFEVVEVMDGFHAIVRAVAGAGGNVDVTNATLTANKFSVQSIAQSSNNILIPKNSFEIIWRPPLGFFEVMHGIPLL
jgi:hypothetical protein